MTLCIGQQHPITVYRTVLWVCAVLVLSVIRRSYYYFFDIILFHHDFHHDICDCYWSFMVIFYFLHFWALYNLVVLVLQIRNSWNVSAPGYSPWILDWTRYLRTTMSSLHSLLRYSTSFTTDCSCGVWCRRLTTCLFYDDPLFGNLVENDSRFVSLN